MKKLLLLSMLLAGCVTQPPVETPKDMKNIGMDCRPEAIIVSHRLNEAGYKAQLISYQTFKLGKRVRGHTIVAYMFPPGKNQLNWWDKTSGSSPVHGIYYGDAWGISEDHINKTSVIPGEYLERAYIDDDIL